MVDDDVKVELERLRAENERLTNRNTRGVSLKVSEKGGVSVYGHVRGGAQNSKSGRQF